MNRLKMRVKRVMKRRPEPELMDSEAQTLAYAEADFDEANSLFIATFQQNFPELPVSGSLADLGCGPGDIALRMAFTLPGWKVTGIDAGENMLNLANKRLAGEPLDDRVSFHLAYLPDPSLPAGAWDAVISNSLLHHLPDPRVLWSSVKTLGTAGASVQVMDLIRPETEADASALVELYAEGAPAILRDDFYNSLLAAYTIDEVREQLLHEQLGQLEIEAASDRHWIVSGTLQS